MSDSYFAPNKSNSGGAAFFSVRPNDGSVYGKFVKQKAWENNKGVFAGGEVINIKFTPSELAGIARAGKTKSNFNFYHSFDGGSVSGTFSYYKIEPKGDQKGREGFGWTIKKDSLEIKVGLTLSDAYRLALYAEYALGLIFEADTANDEAEFKKSKEKKQAENTKTKNPVIKKKPEPTSEPAPEPENEGGEPEGEDDVPF